MAQPLSVKASRAILAAARARGSAKSAGGTRAARAVEALLDAEVVCLLLLGSHAHGRARADSDLDVMVVTRGAPPVVTPGAQLDLRVASLDAFARDGFSPWFCVGPVRVLFDPQGHARRALRVARAVYAAGPTPLSRSQVAVHRAWVARMERRIRADGASDPALAALRLTRLRLRLAELYFEVRAQWPRGDRAAVAAWRRHDPPVAQAFARLAGPASLDQQLALVHQLGRLVFAER